MDLPNIIDQWYYLCFHKMIVWHISSYCLLYCCVNLFKFTWVLFVVNVLWNLSLILISFRISKFIHSLSDGLTVIKRDGIHSLAIPRYTAVNLSHASSTELLFKKKDYPSHIQRSSYYIYHNLLFYKPISVACMNNLAFLQFWYEIIFSEMAPFKGIHHFL